MKMSDNAASRLSPYRLGKARKIYNNFSFFNAVSWSFLAGSIITLFALRLEASATYIGLINAAFYGALFLLPLGKFFARRYSIIGVFGVTWTARSIFMIIAALAPLAEFFGRRDLALLLLLLGVFTFHFFRGIGLVGHNPVLGMLATGPDRGSYLTQIQIIHSAVAMFGSFLLAAILGRDSPVVIYSVLISVGIATGITSGYLIKKVPQPPVEEDESKVKLFSVFREVFGKGSSDNASNDGLKRFMLIFFLIALVSGVVRAFVVVYAREVFDQSDGMIFLYTFFGSLGHLLIGLLVKFLVDRIGAKPLFMVCVIIGLAGMLPAVFFPLSMAANVTTVIIFLSFLFFMLNFGFFGSEGIAQTYFMALVPAKKMLDMGILYFMIFGAAGVCGLFLSGLFLDFLSLLGISPFISFRIFFAAMIALTTIALVKQKGLQSLGSYSFKGALEVIFSIRDLRAISLLDRLSKTHDSREEEILLNVLHYTPSSLAAKSLLEKVRSPRLVMRMESIRALEKMPVFDENTQKALMDDIINNPFTTAYISARTLGKHGCTAAIPLLRQTASSTDYMLAGESIIALAKLKDKTFLGEIEQLILNTKNPRLKIMGAEALGIFGCSNSLSVLLEILRGADPPPYLKDEVVLAMSVIMDTERQFYKVLVRYAEDNSLAVALTSDEVEAAFEFYSSIFGRKKEAGKNSSQAINAHAKNLHAAVFEYMQNKNGTELSRWILQLPDEPGEAETIIRAILAEAVLDDELCAHECLRLLISHWASYKLRVWAKKEKK